MINIESRAGIETLNQILKVPGLDGVVIGPHDLSCSPGIPEKYDLPLFEDSVRAILKKCRNSGIGAGIHFMDNIKKKYRGQLKQFAKLDTERFEVSEIKKVKSPEFIAGFTLFNLNIGKRKNRSTCIIDTTAFECYHY